MDSLLSNITSVLPSSSPETGFHKTYRDKICLKSPKAVGGQWLEGQCCAGTGGPGPIPSTHLSQNILVTQTRSCCPQNRAAHPMAVQKSMAQPGCGLRDRAPCHPSMGHIQKGSPHLCQANIGLGQLLGPQVP